jgi:Protein of unknown function (DUF2490)
MIKLVYFLLLVWAATNWFFVRFFASNFLAKWQNVPFYGWITHHFFIISNRPLLSHFFAFPPFVIALHLLTFSPVVCAQRQVTHQSLYWTRYYLQTSLAPKWVLHLEADNRRFWQPARQHHFIGHLHLHRQVAPQADVALGLTYSRQSPQLPDGSGPTVPEWRPFQEVNLSQSLGKRVTLSQRFRLDERFIQRSNATELLPGHDFNLRFRYRLQLAWRLSPAGAVRPLLLKLADELMVNAGRHIVYNVFDQNRVYLGLEVGLTRRLAVELGYLHWYQQRPSGQDFFAREIVRFTLHHKFSLLYFKRLRH